MADINEENATVNTNETVEDYIPAYTYEQAKEEFDKLGIRYTIKSVVFLKRKGLSFDEMLDYNDYNTILFIGAGLSGDIIIDNSKQSNENRAMEIIDKWLDKGYTLKELWALAYEQARVNGFFTSKDEILMMQTMIENTKDETSKAVITINLLGKQTIANMLEQTGNN